MSTTTWCNMSRKLQRIFEIQHFYYFPELVIYKGNRPNPYQILYSRDWLEISHVFSKCLNCFFDKKKNTFFKKKFFWAARQVWTTSLQFLKEIGDDLTSLSAILLLSKSAQKCPRSVRTLTDPIRWVLIQPSLLIAMKPQKSLEISLVNNRSHFYWADFRIQ